MILFTMKPRSLSLSHPRVTVSMMHARAFIESIPANMKLFIYYYLESMSYELLITAKTAHRIIKNNYRLWMILSSICNNLHITRFYYFVVWCVYRRSVHTFFFSFTHQVILWYLHKHPSIHIRTHLNGSIFYSSLFTT